MFLYCRLHILDIYSSQPTLLCEGLVNSPVTFAACTMVYVSLTLSINLPINSFARSGAVFTVTSLNGPAGLGVCAGRAIVLMDQMPELDYLYAMLEASDLPAY